MDYNGRAMNQRSGRADVGAVGAYALLAALFFWPILFTNAILTGFDTFAIFYPHRLSAARALLNGQLPLWNVDHFLGAPLLANTQVAVFYPLNWPFLAMPPGPSLAWTLALHVFLAAVFAYVFARASLGLRRPAAWLAGVVFAFGGFMGQQTGHLNQVSVAAWLPLILLLGQRIWLAPSVRNVSACALVVGLQFLAGHSQESYMMLATLSAFVAFLALRSGGLRALWRRRGRVAAVMGAILAGAGLAAVQLAPTLELTRLSIRSGGLSFRQASSFSLHPQDLALSLLPNFSAAPPNEMAGYVGVAALLLVVIALLHFPGRALVFFFAATALLALLLAMGRYTPVYWAAYYLAPGVGLFRVPARWLFIMSFALAMLAGMGLDVLLRLGIARGLVRHLAALCAICSIALAAASPVLHVPPPPTVALWALGAVAVLALLWVWQASAQHRRLGGSASVVAGAALCLLIVAELFASGRYLEYNRLAAPESLTTLRPAVAFVQAQQRGQTPPARVLSISDATWDPGDLHDILASFGDEPARRVRDYIDAVKNKELLTANLGAIFGIPSADGYDGGVLPPRRYVELEALFLDPDALSPDGRLRDHLDSIPDLRLLGMLNVEYVITDKIGDAWIDDVYYDLSFTHAVSPDLTLRVERPFVATAVGLIARLEGLSGAPGQPLAELILSDASGRRHRLDILGGQHLPLPGQTVRPRAVPVGGAGEYFHSVLRLPSAMAPTSLAIRQVNGSGNDARIVLRGLSLIDQRTGASLALTVSPNAELVHSGDVKVYRNRLTLPRAYVVRETLPTTTLAALAVMRAPAFDPRRSAVVVEGEDAPRFVETATPDETRITIYEPERVVVEVDLASAGLLILVDAYYPGWQAYIDGEPARIILANTFFRAVATPAGRHTVEFVFRPASLRLGALITIATLSAGALALVVRGRWAATSAGAR